MVPNQEVFFKAELLNLNDWRRVGCMPVFPLFVDIKGKKCVVAGGGKTAFRKIEKLLLFEPEIWVVSPSISNEIYDLCTGKQIKIFKECYDIKYMENAFMAIAATNDRKVNELIYNDAVRKNIFVNVVDCPEMCTFIFPAVIKRDQLVLGISTSGAYPALAREIRKRMEKLVPEYYADLVVLLKEARKRAIVEIRDQAQRKRVLDKILEVFLMKAEKEDMLFLKKNFNSIIDNIINEDCI